MPVSILRPAVEHILMGPEKGRRFTQDSPVLPDVWFAFGKAPSDLLDLLITPYEDNPAPRVAQQLHDAVSTFRGQSGEGIKSEPDIAALQGVMVARLSFREVVGLVLPRTEWWRKNKLDDLVEDLRTGKVSDAILRSVVDWVLGKNVARVQEIMSENATLARSARFLTLFGVLSWAQSANRRTPVRSADQIRANAVVAGLRDVVQGIELYAAPSPILIHLVSRNRDAEPALHESVRAIKADAARKLFTIKCSNITWAILDSGIDADHPAFKDGSRPSRVKAIYDFSEVRRVLGVKDDHAMLSKASNCTPRRARF